MMRWIIYILIGLTVIVVMGWLVYQSPGTLKYSEKILAESVSPGKLSKYHSTLENNCKACHEPNNGVTRDNCVMCHGAQTDILKKQNTSFHSSITSCTGCHFEHQGKEASITKMDHTHFGLVASDMFEMLKNGTLGKDSIGYNLNSTYQTAKKSYHGTDPVLEKSLNCFTCHANQDKHRTLFGTDCSTCHETGKWSIEAFRHPLPTSRDCSQCHTAPPSHYMMHFEMVSKKVAGVEHAKVSQCFMCHQTTSWNDIKGVGWYKHH